MEAIFFSSRPEHRMIRLGLLTAMFACAIRLGVAPYVPVLIAASAIIVGAGAFLCLLPKPILEDIVFVDGQVDHAFRLWLRSRMPGKADEREVAFHALDHVLEKWDIDTICDVMSPSHALVWQEYIRDRAQGYIVPETKYAQIWEKAYPMTHLWW